MILVGTFGLSLVAIGLLEKLDIKLNTELLHFLLEVGKYSAILWILKLASKTFL